MRIAIGLSLLLLAMPIVQAADVEAGKAKVQTVCAACHGANGLSVSDAIPNLAGQKAAYLEVQLKALREGTRKNPIMNAIAGQLKDDLEAKRNDCAARPWRGRARQCRGCVPSGCEASAPARIKPGRQDAAAGSR